MPDEEENAEDQAHDNDQIFRIIRRSTLSNQEYESWWYDSWFKDDFSEESSELPSELEESIRNLTSLTEIFKIIPSQMNKNWLFTHVEQFGIRRIISIRKDKK